jgi:chaperone modulatory protein CbpM
MRVELTEALWFEQHELSLSQLAEISGLPPAVLEELLDCGAIAPLQAGPSELRFGAAALRAARTARRLRMDFELDVQALVVALSLVARVDELEAQLRELQARQPQRIR